MTTPTSLPTWDEFMHPTLTYLANGAIRGRREIYEAVSALMGLSKEQRALVIPSGQPMCHNRISWALSELFAAGLADRPARTQYRTTDEGGAFLEVHPQPFTAKDLETCPGYSRRRVRQTSPSTSSAPAVIESTTLDPVEQIAAAQARLEAAVADELLSRIHSRDPQFFEEVVLKLLIAMGYGGAEGRARRTQLSNDEGIDGVIDQDALGLSRIYVQAKRFTPEAVIHRPEIQKFAGALQGQQANQGVFITTARFSSGAGISHSMWRVGSSLLTANAWPLS